MTTTITVQDGTGDTTQPILITGWAPDAESGNVVHRLLAPGTIAVTLVGDIPRSGNLTLLYADDAEAEAARLLFGRASAFTLTDSERPVVNMTFVRQGVLTPAIHDEVRDVWEFTVGFQEIEP